MVSVYFSVSIDISPAPSLYVVEFEFERPHLGISVILPATCALAAKLEAWKLFPEHKRSASATFVYDAQYSEIDWETGRCFVMKGKRRYANPLDRIAVYKARLKGNLDDEERVQ